MRNEATMSEPTRWSNLATAPPLCCHDLDETLAQPGVEDHVLGGAAFAAMIRATYAKLYEDGAECRHTNPTRR
jgi:hypothetical protein